MGFQKGQQNFSKGVLTPELWGRSDILPYNAAVRQGINVLILKYGGLTKRPGTRFIYEVKETTGAKLFPFEGAYDASYAMLMTQASMRVAARGGMVLEAAQKVTAVTRGNPTSITAAFHGFATGDEVFFTGVLGATWLNGRILKVTVTSGNTFTVPINSTGLAAYTGDTGGTIHSAPPPPPPPPPPVPPPPPPPPPISTGGGGGGTATGTFTTTTARCVATSAEVLLAGGAVKNAGLLVLGDEVWTQHEETLEWGAYPITGLSFADDEELIEITLEGRTLKATPAHRVLVDGDWVHARDIGNSAGRGRVAKISVRGARTYVANGMLSHNIKHNTR